MRHHASVQSVECALIDHIDLASSGLFGWGSKQLDASNEVVLLESDLGTQGRGQSNYSRETSRSKVIITRGKEEKSGGFNKNTLPMVFTDGNKIMSASVAPCITEGEGVILFSRDEKRQCA
jgi:hypothetical protein